MKKFAMILVALFTLSVAIPVLATDTYINLDDLKGLSASAKQELVNKKIKDLENSRSAETAKDAITKINPDEAEKWAKLIGSTIKTVCKDLSVEVNEFIKTDVGKITLALIAYKVIGKDVLNIFFGCVGWVIVISILLLTFRHFHGSTKITEKDDKGNIARVSYTPRYKWQANETGESDAKIVSVVFHAIMFCIFTLVAAIIVII